MASRSFGRLSRVEKVLVTIGQDFDLSPPYKPFPESIEKMDFTIFLPQRPHQSKTVVLVKVDPSQCPPNATKQFLMDLLLDPLLALLKL